MSAALMRASGALLAVLLVAGCGDQAPSGPNAPAPTTAAPPPTASAQPPVNPPPAGKAPATPAAGPGAGLAGRTVELVNPEDATMVFLYYDLAGIAPPIDQWVELDNRVRMAQPRDRAEQRKLVQAELEAGVASVRNVGQIRLSLNSARMSPYDPTYGEFNIGALSPSSVIEFKMFGQVVSLKFANGRTAQIWKVPETEAQTIQDRIGNYPNVALDALLQIKSVLPRPGGGSITADVVEYELREARTGATIARVQVQP